MLNSSHYHIIDYTMFLKFFIIGNYLYLSYSIISNRFKELLLLLLLSYKNKIKIKITYIYSNKS